MHIPAQAPFSQMAPQTSFCIQAPSRVQTSTSAPLAAHRVAPVMHVSPPAPADTTIVAAPAVVVTSFNEGRVPSSIGADMFLVPADNCAEALRVADPGFPLARVGTLDDALAFADYVRALTQWRRLPYLDPGLPPELLPRTWHGRQAGDLFFDLQDLLAEASTRHVHAVTGGVGTSPARSVPA